MSLSTTSIVTNMLGMNASRQLGIVNDRKAKSTEKLSSGYKLNRSADDAAGLAISEKMRRQIRGLDQGAKNIQDGVSLCQVRDGALGNVHDILNRINQLAIQSANETLSDDDRSYLQQEVDQLVGEVNRIGHETMFNEIPIFDYDNVVEIPGSAGSSTTSSAIGTGYLTDVYQDSQGYHPAANLNFGGVNADTVSSLYGKSFSFTCSASCAEAFKFTFIDGDGTQNSASNLSGAVCHEYVIDIHGQTTPSGVLDKVFDYVANHMPNGYSGANHNDLLVSHSNRMVRTSPNSLSLVSNTTCSTAEQAANHFAGRVGTSNPYAKANCSELTGVLIEYEPANAIIIQAGAEADQVIYVSLDKMNAGILGIDPTDISTSTAAGSAIDHIKLAYKVVSEQRSKAGADQNRLEHAYNINNNTVENTSAAESVIRDTDMAKEMVQNAKDNILQQAGQSMLVQANQERQGMLQLLNK